MKIKMKWKVLGRTYDACFPQMFQYNILKLAKE